ncbi:MAG: HDOD domain-containing protein [Desulfobacteraceae bacterium]|nr:HDOD domain-containing protein [Desulfobacteraceae bacterium]
MKNNLLGEKTIADSISLEILTSNIKLPPIPANGAKLLEMVQQPMDKIDISAFAKLVEADPGLLAKVLQMANSPYYSAMDEIVSLKAAITRIGLSEAIQSVSLFFFQKMLPKFPSIEGFSSKEYWAFSWSCAIANRRLGHPNLGMSVLPGELYITGLLHGMGKLLIALHYPHEFSKCVKRARDHKQPLYKVEQDVFGTTDAFIASKIMESWNLPANICAGVAFHQMPGKAPVKYRSIAALTQYAYCLAVQSGIGHSGDGSIKKLSATYVCKHPKLKAFKGDRQEKLAEEILTSLEEKSESVTGVSSKSKAKKSDGKDRRAISSAKNSISRKPDKKGFLVRIWSWIIGN